MTKLKFQIRAATLTDMEPISLIHQQTSSLTYTKSIIEETIKYHIQNTIAETPTFFNVAHLDGDIIAFSIARYRSHENAYELECSCHCAYRNQGLGSTLLKYQIEECHTNGISRFFASVQPNNVPCLSMLKKLGFEAEYISHPQKAEYLKLNLNALR
ncbi:N-acetyltransferase family protein [Pseudomonas sp. ABY48]|uniref:GNAT family N-acetyltransferase n=1 Tax=Pseudomonas sp. ABY48 TaxID=3402865 RepID=UPI003B435674